jgi:hypothetical protein
MVKFAIIAIVAATAIMIVTGSPIVSVGVAIGTVIALASN